MAFQWIYDVYKISITRTKDVFQRSTTTSFRHPQRTKDVFLTSTTYKRCLSDIHNVQKTSFRHSRLSLKSFFKTSRVCWEASILYIFSWVRGIMVLDRCGMRNSEAEVQILVSSKDHLITLPKPRWLLNYQYAIVEVSITLNYWS